MKIVALVDQVAQSGGLERSLALKAGAWVHTGHAVEIVTLEDGRRPPFHAFPDAVVWHHLAVNYDRAVSLFAPRNLAQAVRHFARLKAVLHRVQPHAVIHCGYGYDFYFAPLLAGRRTFLVKENHSSRASQHQEGISLFGRLKNRLRRAVEESYDASVFLSAEEAELAGLSNAVVIPNPASEVRIAHSVRTNVVIAAGRICRVKGFDRLLEAWAIARPSLPGWSLEIYGDGEPSDVAALQSQVTALRLTDCVRIQSATSDILSRIARSSVFAMTSRTECFPMVLLESMQLGVPIVAFDCPTGPRNILTHGITGRLVADGDIAGYAAALVDLARDEEGRKNLASNAIVEVKRYSLEKVNGLWDRLFRQACTS